MEAESQRITKEQWASYREAYINGDIVLLPDGIISNWMIKDMPRMLEERYRKMNAKYYDYFITFTLSPGASEEEALEWICNRKNCDYFVSASYVEEKTQAGASHWHMILKSSKSLEKSRFKYYSKYGYIDFKRITPKTEQNVHDYINKVGIVQTLN